MACHSYISEKGRTIRLIMPYDLPCNANTKCYIPEKKKWEFCSVAMECYVPFGLSSVGPFDIMKALHE